MLWNLKDKLLWLWINPADLQWVDFNDMNSLNQLAQKIVPNLLKSNPQVAQQIKQAAPNIAPDNAEDIVKIIGG